MRLLRRALRFGLPPRLLKAAGLAALVTLYLATGAGWKVLMVTRHANASPLTENLREAMSLYSKLPVGYALGPRFGRLCYAFRLVGPHPSESQGSVKEAAAIYKELAETPGSWSDVAAYSRAALEADPGVTSGKKSEVGGTNTFVLYLDEQRWGRTTIERSSSLDDAAADLRAAAVRWPHSLVAFDSLVRLAAIEDGSWEFTDAQVCRLTAEALQPERTGARRPSRTPGRVKLPDLSALASAYAVYLRAPLDQRRLMTPALRRLSLSVGDQPLARSLTLSSDPAVQPVTSPGADSVGVTWDGAPLSGARLALLRAAPLEAALHAEQASRSSSTPGGRADLELISKTVSTINPARPEDLFARAGAALVSLSGAGRVASHLDVRSTDAGGLARFPTPPEGSTGLIALIAAPGPDMCLSPRSLTDRPESLRFVPRVAVLPTVVLSGSPPVLRWEAYPGASSYRVIVTREAPGSADQSTAIAPDWDRYTAWWRDGVQTTRISMDPDGFVGPASEPEFNGLWAGQGYRVVIEAQDETGTPIASSIGMTDHAEEFFTIAVNWLALAGRGAQTPMKEHSAVINFRRHGPGSHERHFFAETDTAVRTDPLEEVLDLARSHTPILPGRLFQEPALQPCDPGSPSAVHLCDWPSINDDGQGPIPLRNPLFDRTLPRTAPGSLPSSGIPGIPALW